MTGKGSRPLILALDCAGSACSAAVAVDETVLWVERVETRHGQAETLLPLVDAAMHKAGASPSELNLVAATVGPGSFTGIRVGLAAAYGIALATGAHLIGVTSFEAAAGRCDPPDSNGVGFLLIALESRREEFFVQLLDPSSNPVGEPAAVMPAGLGESLDAAIGAAPLLIAGDAAERAAFVLSQRPDTVVLEHSAPDAIGVLRTGFRRWRRGVDLPAPRPLYLRPPDVTLSGRRQSSSLGRT